MLRTLTDRPVRCAILTRLMQFWREKRSLDTRNSSCCLSRLRFTASALRLDFAAWSLSGAIHASSTWNTIQLWTLTSDQLTRILTFFLGFSFLQVAFFPLRSVRSTGCWSQAWQTVCFQAFRVPFHCTLFTNQMQLQIVILIGLSRWWKTHIHRHYRCGVQATASNCTLTVPRCFVRWF